MQLIGPLTGANPMHWAYVPAVEKRIHAFVRMFHSDQDPVQVTQTFKAHFVAETGLAPLWLWTTDDVVTGFAPVKGHLAAWLDAGRRRSLFVGQVWSDVPVPEPLRVELIESLEGHARKLGCWALEDWVENPAILRLYRKIGLADPVMTAVRRVLVDPAVATAKEPLRVYG